MDKIETQNDKNKKSYNNISGQWINNRKKSELNNLVIDFSKKIKYGGRILDIGCGTGYPIAKYFSDNGFIVTGIDISEKLLQEAIDQHIKNANFYLCDFFNYKPKEKYDGIIAFDSFFHFEKNKQEKIYKIVSEWMEKGSYILFTHGNIDGEITGEMYGETFYYSSLKTKRVHELLKNSNIEIELSIEKYKEKNMDRDLVIIGRKE
ncbi:methyltransferase [Spirochaetia bacterium]|nr:methyltransferase [Spirochaetia bacterium]